MKKFQVRQGDVYIIADQGVPTDGMPKQKLDNGRCILAYGEVTGHAHAMTGAATMYGNDVASLLFGYFGYFFHQSITLSILPLLYSLFMITRYLPRGILMGSCSSCRRMPS